MKKSKKTRKQESKSFFRQRYENSIDLIKKSKNYIFAGIFFFLFSIIIGFVFPQLFQEQVTSAIQNIIASLEGKSTTGLIVHIFLNNLRASFLTLIFGAAFGIFPLITTIINGYIIGFVSVISVAERGIFVLWRLVPHGIFEIPAIILAIGIGLYLGSKIIEKNFKIKSDTKKITIILLITLLLAPLFAVYYISSTNLIELSPEQIRTAEPLIILQLIYNSLFSLFLLGAFFYTIYQFYKDKNLKKELVDSLWFFIFVIIPLLVIAAIIEGLLIGLIQ